MVFKTMIIIQYKYNDSNKEQPKEPNPNKDHNIFLENHHHKKLNIEKKNRKNINSSRTKF